MKRLNSIPNHRNSMVKLVAICCVLLPTIGFGQIVSNRGQGFSLFAAHVGTESGVSGDIGAANAFTTGNNSAGYTLTAVRFTVLSILGSPEHLQARIHEDSSSVPGNVVTDGTLLGLAESGFEGSEFTHTGLFLTANTTYHLALTTPGSTSGDNRSVIGRTSSASEDAPNTDGWTIGNTSNRNSGGSWSSQTEPLLFSITATAVPEPHEYALMVGLGLVGFVAVRRRLPKATLA